MTVWWEKWPGRLERELADLDAAGIKYARDEAQFSQGIACLDLQMPIADGETTPLKVVFPDLYPYFRFEVYAPELDLPYHQNPFEKNLCLLGRRTHFWNPHDTLAGILTQQLPSVIQTAHSSTKEEVAGLEQEQAEPFSDHYPYAPNVAMVQSDWSIPSDVKYGSLLIGTSAPASMREFRGPVVEIRGGQGVLWAADKPLRDAFQGKQLQASWARVSAPLKDANSFALIKTLLAMHSSMPEAKPNHVTDGWLCIWGVLFPEEIRHRQLGEGWVFLCASSKNRDELIRLQSRRSAAHHKQKRKGRK